MRRFYKAAATIALTFLAITTLANPFEKDTIEKKKVRGAYGEWVMSPDMTGGEVMARALHEAKEDALRKAGVSESVWSIFGQMSTTTNSIFLEAYSEMSVLAIEGKVAVNDKNSSWIINKAGLPVYTVKIDTEVTVDNNEEDLTYAITTKGIDAHYKNHDKFSCSFTLDGSDSYLKVFYFNNESSGMMYPDSPEAKNTKFKAGETYSFPISKNGSQAYIQLEKSGENPENLLFVFVATKKNYPYLGDDDATSILQWIYSIPANERTIDYKQCTIF